MKKIILTLGILSCTSVFSNPQEQSVWQDYEVSAQTQLRGISAKDTVKQRTLILDAALFRSQLSVASNKQLSARATSPQPTVEIDLPLPNGGFVRVKATDSPILSPEMSERYPDIRTWSVVGVDDPAITGRIDFTIKGFHGMLTLADGDTVYIDPDDEQAGNIYRSFSKQENASLFHNNFNCEVHDEHAVKSSDSLVAPAAKILASAPALNRKTYRLAVAGTGEYTASQGGTKALAQASMATTINRVNQIYIRDIGISLQLVSGQDLIYTNAATDPYTNNSSASALVDDNITNMAAYGSANFDLGHVFTRGSLGGLAYVGVACIGAANTSGGVLDPIKAGGATGTTNPQGESFSIEYVAHEVGHQLGATHTFNSTLNGCGGGNRTGTTAVEPGSGSTIMSYSGLCSSDNVQNNSDATFHFASISQINSYTRGGSGNCGTDTSTGNQNPVANAGGNYNMPANTPFLLDGSAIGGTTYSWDQTDTGSASPINVDTGNNAIIRNLLPSGNEDRYIPSLSKLFSGGSTAGEILPQTSRALNFTYVVRDGSGGIGTSSKTITVTNTGSTFAVASQSSATTFATNQSVSILWNTAFTNVAPINCSNVDIQLLRSNGVKNMLLASTPNDGSEQVTIPATTPTMTGARVMVGCSDNSFFNISSGNVSVQTGVADTTPPVISISGANPVSIPQGSVYTDAGATAIDNIDGVVAVSTSGTVNTAVVGGYTITYSATDSSGNNTTATRTVNVNPIVDVTPPVITLNGSSIVNVVIGGIYSEAGATALDNVDGVVAVTLGGSVNTAAIGVYTITYTAKDAANNSANKTRTVNVTAIPLDTVPPVITLNGSSTVNIVVGSSYSDAGATATDNVDGAIAVSSSGTVNTNITCCFRKDTTITNISKRNVVFIRNKVRHWVRTV